MCNPCEAQKKFKSLGSFCSRSEYGSSYFESVGRRLRAKSDYCPQLDPKNICG
jgi:hypothetical protein